MSSCLADEAILLYLQDLAPVATLLFDRAERVVSANAHAVAVIGRNPAGLRPREVFVDFSGTLSLEDMLRDPSQTYLLHIDRSPGLPRTLQFRARRIADQILLLGDHDPTEQERLQEQIFSLNQELTNLTRGLQKSNAELVRLNQLKNQMLGMAAHDLRGPLGVIMSYGEFLSEELALSVEQREFLERIVTTSEYMLRMVENVLDISAIEAGKLELNALPADLVDLTRRHLAMMQHLAARKQIKLHLMHDEATVRVSLDPDKFAQVITNLVSNALKYSPRGRDITVTIQCNASQIVFSVADQGPGIPAAELGLLFKPFGTASTKTTGGEKRTGLGLAIVRRIVNAHGGEVQVASEVGKGSVFSVLLTRM